MQDENTLNPLSRHKILEQYDEDEEVFLVYAADDFGQVYIMDVSELIKETNIEWIEDEVGMQDRK